MNFRKRQINRTLAFAKREFKLRVRYKWPFISEVIILPLIHAAPIVILYAGLMSVAPTDIPGLTQNNYLAWVLLGSFVYSTFIYAWRIFRRRFIEEKFWMTIHGTLIAPVSKYYLLFGVIIELGVEGIVMAAPFLIISYIVMPTHIIHLLLIFVVFMLILIGGAGISLINGTFYLVNENLASVFDYLLFILVFLSTYLIPYNLYPSFLQGFVNINPLYHFINITRNIWFETFSIDLLWSFLFIIGFCIISVILGVYFFTKTTRRLGVRGY